MNCYTCKAAGTPSYKSPCSECLKSPTPIEMIPVSYILEQAKATEYAEAYNKLVEKWRAENGLS